jgi:hypothetical protein
MKRSAPILFFLMFTILGKISFSQSLCNFQLQWQSHYPGFVSPLTLEADVTGKPFLYVASNEYGLKIYHLDGTLSSTLDTNLLAMRVMSFTQYGNLLYVAIGSQWSNDPPGLAIVDVTNPASPVVKDIWIHPIIANSDGAGIVKVEGNYAYLGAMELGLVILDISNPSSISFVSETHLDIHYPYPGPSTIDPKKYNLRGMEVRNKIVYGADDAGGIRIINCTNLNSPKETGHYANPITYVPSNQARAYNNIVLNETDTIAYVAVDYCGFEVLNVSDTSNITLMDNFNPHNAPTGFWWTSPIHANEMKYNSSCKKVFMSTGKSEMIALDVSNPNAIDSCGGYGSLLDTTGTWGIGMRNDSIFLSYVYVPVCFAPFCAFPANWNGIKMVKWLDPCMAMSAAEEEKNIDFIKMQPNPFDESTMIRFYVKNSSAVNMRITDLMGRSVFNTSMQCRSGENEFLWNGNDYSQDPVTPGIYFFSIQNGNEITTTKLLKSR